VYSIPAPNASTSITTPDNHTWIVKDIVVTNLATANAVAIVSVYNVAGVRAELLHEDVAPTASTRVEQWAVVPAGGRLEVFGTLAQLVFWVSGADLVEFP